MSTWACRKTQRLIWKILCQRDPSKQWLLDEQKAMEAAPTLGIRVPTIHRVVIDEKNNFFVMIMDLIPGSNVYDSWFKLSWRSTISLALQMRQILHALSTITSPVTGKLVNSIIESPWIEAGYPPARRSTPAMFAGYLSAWTTLPKGVGAGWPFPVRPNIFVHQDLVFRNIHVDPQNRLWVLDWGYAGYFPSCFESMAIVEDPLNPGFLSPTLHGLSGWVGGDGVFTNSSSWE
ncbi:hypothetical protein D9757_006532 [Collybiopsis confluens]|uniref:Aminoglycoside phosphotransferase domain-containing protein n=1 Tax=Collybiopsis confluens TaxID=2823264 RepID=A0A8H5HQ78_9AGAR|nr:hypothetical protein D9757_006532 [Collybiopsis confluens]